MADLKVALLLVLVVCLVAVANSQVSEQSSTEHATDALLHLDSLPTSLPLHLPVI